jgi:hypothetical protein
MKKIIIVLLAVFLVSCYKEEPALHTSSLQPIPKLTAKPFYFSFKYEIGDSIKTIYLLDSNLTSVDSIIIYCKFNDGSISQLPYGSKQDSLYLLYNYNYLTGKLDIKTSKRILSPTNEIQFKATLIKYN